MLNKKALMGSVSAAPSDEYFKNTVLLLHGDGTNGAQNNTFTDSSTNAYSITRVGNTTQGTFSPFSQTGWSNYFDGTGDYLSAALTSSSPGTGDFTFEGWINKSDTSHRGIFQLSTTSGGLAATTTNTLAFGYENGVWQIYAKNTDTKSSSYTINVGQWYHFALVRNSSTTKLYINGTAVITVTSDTTDYTGTNIAVGGFYSTTFLQNGYISNFRYVKGTAVYTADFTPPTTALTAITNTSLLTCQSNRFVDNSTNAFAITVNGDTSVQAFSPFAPTAAYSASTVGGSGYFDGNGDYLETSSSVSLTGNFTLEAWIMQTDKTVNGGFFTVGDTITNAGSLCIYIDTNQLVGVYFNGSYEQSAGTTSPNGWNHCAVVRSGSSGYLYLNGTRVYSWTPGTTTISGAVHISRAIASGNTYYSKGYVSSARILKGTALYTGSTYTVPTAPFTAIANTEFLCNFTNAGIIDNTAKNDLETVGNAQIDTTTKKYGTGSLEFDGSGDWLILPDSPSFDFGSGNFTIEGWVYLSSLSGATGIITKRATTSDYPPFVIYVTAGGIWAARGSTSGSAWDVSIISSTQPSTSTWYHVAFVRNGDVYTLYIDGTSIGTTTVSGALYKNTSTVVIGAYASAGTSPLTGYIDDLRLTKGIARYTANFTAPTKAFEDQ